MRSYQRVPAIHTEHLNGLIRGILPPSSRLIGRVLPFSDPHDDIAWEIVTQVRSVAVGLCEIKSIGNQEWHECYELGIESFGESDKLLPLCYLPQKEDEGKKTTLQEVKEKYRRLADSAPVDSAYIVVYNTLCMYTSFIVQTCIGAITLLRDRHHCSCVRYAIYQQAVDDLRNVSE